MYCNKCGKTLEDEEEVCPSCGGSALEIIHSHMAEAVIAMCVLCFPLGLAAVYYAIISDVALLKGNLGRAIEFSEYAEYWFRYALIVFSVMLGIGMLVGLIYEANLTLSR